MPADESLTHDQSAGTHGDGVSPYWCSKRGIPPGHGSGFIDYGYCRTSLDLWPEHYQQGSSDPRCPRDCPNKASPEVAAQFQAIYKESGNAKAAEYTAEHRRMRDD